MASDLYNTIGQPQPVQPQAQNPRETALNLLRQYGYQFTPEQANDPNTLMQMVLQSGQLFQNRLPMAQNILRQFMGRR